LFPHPVNIVVEHLIVFSVENKDLPRLPIFRGKLALVIFVVL